VRKLSTDSPRLFDIGTVSTSGGPVECFGLTFESDEARRAYFLDRLREKLRDPAFRAREGFPRGTDDVILTLSDPPYYTACPNPFLEDFIAHYGVPYNDAGDDYHRNPLAVDVSAGKTDKLYAAHSYHTKVPHKAIIPALLHYTNPGDIVLDAFGGSGMTGVAAQVCGNPEPDFRQELEAAWRERGAAPPQWGARRIVLNDLGPAATFIEANYNLPFDVSAFAEEARRILKSLATEWGWMYETTHTDGKTTGRINFTVWSQVFDCPQCGQEIVFLKEALDLKTKRVRETFPCPHCATTLNKDDLDRLMVTTLDLATGQPWQHIRMIPVLINYNVGKTRYEKEPDDGDRAVLKRIETQPLPQTVPTNAFPIKEMSHGSRLAPKGFTHEHQMFLPRPVQALGRLWEKATAIGNTRSRNMLLFFVEQAIWTASLLNRYRPTGYSQVNQYLTGVYYVASQHAECSPWYILEGKLKRLVKAFNDPYAVNNAAMIATGTAAATGLPKNSIDYVFTDPPFGENIFYADLNFLVESWHHVWTSTNSEAIIDPAKHKGLHEYQGLMQRCFEEYYRVLKPGRWMTVVFHNSSNAVWNAIQQAMLAAGFVVADVRMMDKIQDSFRQVTSSAVKQDLIISAYKPKQSFIEQFDQEAGTEQGAWDFVRQHLAQASVFVTTKDKDDKTKGRGEIIAERQPNLLYDRMIAFHIQRGATIPLGAAEFYAGLKQRFPEADGMFFLPTQVTEYEQHRAQVAEMGQLPLLINDERSTIRWLRQELDKEPQLTQQLRPKFMLELHKAQHEQLPELAEILEQNFLEDEQGRWFVPDPAKQSDMERVREKALLREFETYANGRGRLKVFRTEAVRVGFLASWKAGNYRVIVDVAQRLPDAVLQEDGDLLMLYDNASDRVEESGQQRLL